MNRIRVALTLLLASGMVGALASVMASEIASESAMAASQFPQLETELGRDPAKVLNEVTALKSRPDLSANARAELHLLAAEANLTLTLGREALEQADAGLALLPAVNDPMAMPTEPVAVRLLLARALALDLLSQPAKAVAAVNRLIESLQRPAQDRQLLVEALSARATLLLSLNDRPAALADMQRAYAMALPAHARIGRGDVASLMANLYSQQENNENAMRYYSEAVKLFQESGEDIKLSIAVFGLGAMYRVQQNWPEARRYFGWSLELSRQRDDKQGVAYAEQQLANIAIETGQLQDAANLLDSAEPLFAEAEDYAMQINTLLSRATLASKQQRYTQAMANLQSAEQIAERTEMQWKLPAIWLKRAELYATQQRFAEAYEAYRRFHREYELAFRAESDRQLQELRVRFDSDRQDQQNTLLRQQNALQEAALAQQRQRTWLYVAVAMLSLLATLFLLYSIYKSRQVRDKLDRLAHTDELTGLPNRRHLMQQAQAEINRAQRYQTPLCLAVLDLDLFKQVNDRFGHHAGDEVLRHFALLCRAKLRDSDVVGRMGGEEFVLVLPHTALPVARQILERLREDFKAMNIAALGAQHPHTVSIGVTPLSAGDVSLADLLRRADEALYAAKSQGRDRVVAQVHASADTVGGDARSLDYAVEKY